MILRQGRLLSTQKGARFPPAWHIFFRKMIAWMLARITEGHKAQPSCWERSQISQHGKSQTHEKLVFCYSAIQPPHLKCCLLGNTVSTVANLLLSSCLVKLVKRARWQRLVCYTLSQPLGIPPLVSDVETPRDTRTPRLGWGPADTNKHNREGQTERRFLNRTLYSVKLHFCRQLQKHLEQGRANRLRDLLLLMTLNSENLPVFFFGPVQI